MEHRGLSFTDLRDECVRVLREAVQAVEAQDYGKAIDLIEDSGKPVIHELDLTASKGVIFGSWRARVQVWKGGS
jgi:hypothetical protein